MGKKKAGGNDKPKDKRPVVDKTFGMKNKKGASAQKQIQSQGLNHQKNEQDKKKDKSQADKKKLKLQKEEQERFLKSLGYKAPDKKKGPKKEKKTEEDEVKEEEEDAGADTTEDLADDEPSKGRRVLAREAREIEAANCVKPKEVGGVQFTLEELIETKRQKLHQDVEENGKKLTPVTEETFKAWKRKKLIEKKAQLKKEQKKLKKALETGNANGVSGKAMFTLGHAKDADIGDADDNAGGGFDLLALRREKEAAETALEDKANEDEDADVDSATLKTKKMFSVAKKIDESLFAMDLGDLGDIPDLSSDEEEEEEKTAPQASDDGTNPSTSDDSSATQGDKDKVTVDASLFDASLLGDMGDLDDLDD